MGHANIPSLLHLRCSRLLRFGLQLRWHPVPQPPPPPLLIWFGGRPTFALSPRQGPCNDPVTNALSSN